MSCLALARAACPKAIKVLVTDVTFISCQLRLQAVGGRMIGG